MFISQELTAQSTVHYFIYKCTHTVIVHMYIPEYTFLKKSKKVQKTNRQWDSTNKEKGSRVKATNIIIVHFKKWSILYLNLKLNCKISQKYKPTMLSQEVNVKHKGKAV